jgi:hypothetical protein
MLQMCECMCPANNDIHSHRENDVQMCLNKMSADDGADSDHHKCCSMSQQDTYAIVNSII